VPPPVEGGQENSSSFFLRGAVERPKCRHSPWRTSYYDRTTENHRIGPTGSDQGALHSKSFGLHPALARCSRVERTRRLPLSCRGLSDAHIGILMRQIFIENGTPGMKRRETDG